jgi:MerR family transcriptional regulator, copper efflux regulator
MSTSAGQVRLQLATDKVDEGVLRIGDLARESGKTVRAIHLYEELGLLEPAARSPGGFRLYHGDALVRVRWIGKLQEMGFTLAEIQQIVRSYGESKSAPGAMVRLREVYAVKLRETRTQLERLESLTAELEASLRYLDTCETCDPVRLLDACPRCDVHDCNDHPPELVAGVQKR